VTCLGEISYVVPEVPVLAPVRAPGVLDEPVVLSQLLVVAIAHQNHRVVSDLKKAQVILERDRNNTCQLQRQGNSPKRVIFYISCKAHPI
jgi:hypothetical protein